MKPKKAKMKKKEKTNKAEKKSVVVKSKANASVRKECFKVSKEGTDAAAKSTGAHERIRSIEVPHELIHGNPKIPHKDQYNTKEERSMVNIDSPHVGLGLKETPFEFSSDTPIDATTADSTDLKAMVDANIQQIKRPRNDTKFGRDGTKRGMVSSSGVQPNTQESYLVVTSQPESTILNHKTFRTIRAAEEASLTSMEEGYLPSDSDSYSTRPGAVSIAGMGTANEAAVSQRSNNQSMESTLNPIIVATAVDPDEYEKEVQRRLEQRKLDADQRLVPAVPLEETKNVPFWKTKAAWACVFLVAIIGVTIGVTVDIPVLTSPSHSSPPFAYTNISSSCEELCHKSTGLPVTVNDKLFKKAILDYLKDPASSPYGSNINCWDVSSVTNMSFAFSYHPEGHQHSLGNPELEDPIFQTFNENLNCWNTSAVIDMKRMFRGASSFNGMIGTWDTSRVKNMLAMFSLAIAFETDIGSWDTSEVTTMRFMFADATSFNADIRSWDTSRVEDMHAMFWNATSFDVDLGGWQTSAVTNMSYMFYGATSFNQDLCSWKGVLNTETYVDVIGMFTGSGCNNTADPSSSQWCFSCVHSSACNDPFSSQNLNCTDSTPDETTASGPADAFFDNPGNSTT